MKISILGYTIAIQKKEIPFVKPENLGSRRSGRSTRLMDSFVQQLFNEGEVKIYDHHPLRNSDRHLFNRVLKRLYKEHGLNEKYLDINKSTYTIKYKSFGQDKH